MAQQNIKTNLTIWGTNGGSRRFVSFAPKEFSEKLDLVERKEIGTIFSSSKICFYALTFIPKYKVLTVYQTATESSSARSGIFLAASIFIPHNACIDKETLKKIMPAIGEKSANLLLDSNGRYDYNPNFLREDFPKECGEFEEIVVAHEPIFRDFESIPRGSVAYILGSEDELFELMSKPYREEFKDYEQILLIDRALTEESARAGFVGEKIGTELFLSKLSKQFDGYRLKPSPMIESPQTTSRLTEQSPLSLRLKDGFYELNLSTMSVGDLIKGSILSKEGDLLSLNEARVKLMKAWRRSFRVCLTKSLVDNMAQIDFVDDNNNKAISYKSQIEDRSCYSLSLSREIKHIRVILKPKDSIDYKDLILRIKESDLVKEAIEFKEVGFKKHLKSYDVSTTGSKTQVDSNNSITPISDLYGNGSFSTSSQEEQEKKSFFKKLIGAWKDILALILIFILAALLGVFIGYLVFNKDSVKNQDEVTNLLDLAEKNEVVKDINTYLTHNKGEVSTKSYLDSLYSNGEYEQKHSDKIKDKKVCLNSLDKLISVEQVLIYLANQSLKPDTTLVAGTITKSPEEGADNGSSEGVDPNGVSGDQGGMTETKIKPSSQITSNNPVFPLDQLTDHFDIAVVFYLTHQKHQTNSTWRGGNIPTRNVTKTARTTIMAKLKEQNPTRFNQINVAWNKSPWKDKHKNFWKTYYSSYKVTFPHVTNKGEYNSEKPFLYIIEPNP